VLGPLALTQDVTDFEADVILQVYSGVSKVPELIQRLDTRYNTLMRTVNKLAERELVETSTYQEGLFGEYERVQLTPEGRRIAKSLSRAREPETTRRQSVAQTETSRTGQTEPQPESGGVKQQITVTQQGSDGWKVCGYLCLFSVIVFIVLFIIFPIWLGVSLIGWIMHLLGL
jgi:DNA-binding MarR family transcriptional regulator